MLLVAGGPILPGETGLPFEAFGAGCGRTGQGAPAIGYVSGIPRAGGSTTLKCIDPAGQNLAAFLLVAASDTDWYATPLPYDLGQLGMPGCLLYVGIDEYAVFQLTAGRAEIQLTWPLDPAINGTPLFFQALVVDPQANAFGLRVSSAARLTLVR